MTTTEVMAMNRSYISQVDTFREAAGRYAELAYREAELEAGRSVAKQAAVERIMAETGKAATPAEKLAESDPEYSAYLGTLRDVARSKHRAWADQEAARLLAKLYSSTGD